jgi:hypothetical protein
MKILALVPETYHYMTVELEPGIQVEFKRGPLGDWYQPIPNHEGCYIELSIPFARTLELLYLRTQD